MRTLLNPALIILALLFAHCGTAPKVSTGEYYDLNGKADLQLEVPLKQSMEFQGKGGEVLINVMGMDLKGEMVELSNVNEFVDTYTSGEEFEREFLVMKEHSVFMMMGERVEEGETSPLEGIKATYRKEEGSWQIVDKSRYNYNIQEELTATLEDIGENLETGGYPEKIQLNTPWKMSGADFSRFMGAMGGKGGGKGTLTLVDVREINGDKIATINYEIEANNVAIDDEGEGSMLMSVSMKGQIKRSLTHYIDLEVTGTGPMSISGEFKDEGTTGHMELKTTMTLKMKQSWGVTRD